MESDELRETEVEIGIDEDGELYFQAGSQPAALAFIILLLAEGAAGIIQYEKEDALERVRANNKKHPPALKPMINCPKMVYAEACAACVWRDGEGACHGG